MATGTKLEKPEPLAMGMKPEPFGETVEHDVASVEGVASFSTSSVSKFGDAKSNPKSEGNGNSGFKGVPLQASSGEQSIYNPPTSSYNYYYPGFYGSFAQPDDHGYYQMDGSHMGMQSDNGSLVYYLPGGYVPYMAGSVVGVDGQNVGQQPYFSSGYIQHPVSYGLEAMPCYSLDSTFVGDVSNGNIGSKNGKYGSGSTFSKSNGFSSVKSNGNNSSNSLKSLKSTESVRPPNKVSTFGSDFSGGLLKRFNQVNNYSLNPVQKHGSFSHNGPTNFRHNGRIWNGNDRVKSRDRFHKNNDLDTSPELTCGPRASSNIAPLDSSVKKDSVFAIDRSQYNQPDFETVYTDSKFYVIKSYNEDDIHKSIKYGVWSSTPNGNKKLDAAFCDAEQKSTESETKCPIFLFFSVNGSGQFIGIAEMVGQVDFDKDMDFWQLDKWNGFFPVKWHVIKDIPNHRLRHIVLENNERRPVTFSRDTQEIPLKQGLELLCIFKGYAAKSSLLDDFDFYEKRETSSIAKKNKLATLRMEELTNGVFSKNNKYEDGSYENENDLRMNTVVDLTKNLSLNSQS